MHFLLDCEVYKQKREFLYRIAEVVEVAKFGKGSKYETSIVD